MVGSGGGPFGQAKLAWVPRRNPDQFYCWIVGALARMLRKPRLTPISRGDRIVPDYLGSGHVV
jgi:hypothetical protein